MFWADADLMRKRDARIHLPPPVPPTTWTPPTEFPNLSAASLIGFDTETKERDFDNGPGWARGLSHVVGFSVSARDRLGNTGAWYFPIRHEMYGEDNLDPRNALGWLGSVLDTPEVPKVGANLTYDIGTLIAEGVTVTGPLHDVQFAEALIDSEAFVALDVLGRKYVGTGKTSAALYDWIRRAYPNTPESGLRGNIYRTPPRLVGPYAIDDALLPMLIMDKQYPLLENEGLLDVYRMECDLIPLMIQMRYEGVCVNTGKAAELVEQFSGEIKTLYERVRREYSFDLQSTASGQLGKLFDLVGVQYPRTEVGNPSIRKEFLAALEHPVGDLIADIREREKIVGTFLKGYVLNKSIPIPGSNSYSKLYPQLHQLKGDENGTIVGRFSSSDPNLQNIPSRTELGKQVRDCFEMDPGHHHWAKYDQSQVHYRILAHNAVGPGSDELREQYINDPKTDYHDAVYHRVAPLMNWDTTDDKMNKFRRRPIKNVNFGLLYGQSIKALMYKTAMYFGEGFGMEEAKAFFDAYFEGAPYVKPTMAAIGKEVQFFGYVTTLMGRKVRFNLFEPAKKDWDNPVEPLPYQAALRTWGSALKYAYEYRGVNYKFQGSEPDIMKKGMLDCYKSGVFNHTGVPRLTVHDELDFSVQDDTERTREAFRYIRHLMEQSIKMRVPLRVDESTGISWGKAD